MSRSAAVAAHNTKAPRRSPLNMKAPPEKISEAKRQIAVVNALRMLSYTVHLLGQKRQPVFCKACKTLNWPITTANTPGTADVQVTHDRWFGCWLALELKTPDTTRRPEQVELARRGMNVIVETVPEALDAVLHLERQMGIAPLPAMTAYREQL